MLLWLIKKILVWLLGFVNPRQPYGTELFNALARVVPFMGLEAVCLRCAPNGNIEVYLVQRALDDKDYPGQPWHAPGSILRTDETFDNVFARLEIREFGCCLLTKCQVVVLNNPEEPRGHAVSLVHLCIMEDGVVGHGSWFPVDALPKPTIPWHRDHVIPAAVAAFNVASS